MRQRIAVAVAFVLVLSLATGSSPASAGWSAAATTSTAVLETGSFSPSSRVAGGPWTPWEQLPDAWGAAAQLDVVDGAPVSPGSTVYTELEIANTGDLDGSASIGAAAVEWAAASELDVVQVAAGVRHSLLLTRDGSVYAYGSGADGQLGSGLFSGSSVPVRVVGGAQGGTALSRIVQVVAGDNISAALADDGTVYVWGSGYWGSLGTGVNGDGVRQPVPSAVPKTWTGTIVEISLDTWRGTILARTSTGVLYGWGSGDAVLGGARSMTPKLIPAGDLGGTGLSGVRTMNVGSGFALAVAADGRVLVWGNRDGNSGEMGNGTIGSQPAASSNVPRWLPGGAQGGVWFTGAVDVSAGGTMAAVDSSGVAFVWGGGTTAATRVGLVGVSGVDSRLSPVLFTTTDGRVFSAGVGASSGAGGASGTLTAPVQVASGEQGEAGGLAGVHQAAGGSGFGVAVTTGGAVFSWGGNTLGELGVGGRVEQLIGVGRISRDATTADVTLTTTMNVQRSATAAARLAVRDDGANRLEASFQSIDGGRLELASTVGDRRRVLYSSVGEVSSEVVGLGITAIGRQVVLLVDGVRVFEGALDDVEATALISTRVSLLVDGASVSQTGITAPAVWPVLGVWTPRTIGGGVSYAGDFTRLRVSFNSTADIPGVQYRSPVLHWTDATGAHSQPLDLAAWTTTGSATISGGVASIPTPGGSVLSPALALPKQAVWSMSFESAMTVDSPRNATYTGYNAGSSYTDEAGNAVPNNANWTGNGYAAGVPTERIVLAEGWEDLRNWVTDQGAPRVTTSDSAGGRLGDQPVPVQVRRAPVLLYSAYLNPTSCSAAGVSAATRIVDGWDIRIAPGKVVSLTGSPDGTPIGGQRLCLQLGSDLAGVLGVVWPMTAEITKD
ncbi:hypothetical protein KXS11_04265 [Plantibacter flavus]|uniref:RCC1 domain-containing protein n=1 Tax=Plantibacter flavus TaxID=150123 RepID=UPI003F14B10E